MAERMGALLGSPCALGRLSCGFEAAVGLGRFVFHDIALNSGPEKAPRR